MSVYTHQKRAYHATALRWNGANTDDVIALLNAPVQYINNYLMVRYPGGITTLAVGMWVVRGEDGRVKCYKDKVFKIKYEELK